MGKVGFVLAAAASSVVILDLVSAPRSMLRPVVEFPALVNLGRISYGLYLYHYPIYHFVGERFSDSGFTTRVFRMLASTLLVGRRSRTARWNPRFLGLKVRFARSDGRQTRTGEPTA